MSQEPAKFVTYLRATPRPRCLSHRPGSNSCHLERLTFSVSFTMTSDTISLPLDATTPLSVKLPRLPARVACCVSRLTRPANRTHTPHCCTSSEHSLPYT